MEEKARIDIGACSLRALRSLPHGMCVCGELISKTRVDPMFLPEQLRALKLDLYNCQGGVEVSHGTCIADGMFLEKCRISKLPTGLIVGELIYVSNCKDLMDLPKDMLLSLDGRVYYNNHTGFAGNKEKLEELQERFPGQIKTLF